MSHIQHPTFHNYMALASDPLNLSQHSPLAYTRPLYLSTESRLELNDFQSNAHVNIEPAFTASPLIGLVIHSKEPTLFFPHYSPTRRSFSTSAGLSETLQGCRRRHVPRRDALFDCSSHQTGLSTHTQDFRFPHPETETSWAITLNDDVRETNNTDLTDVLGDDATPSASIHAVVHSSSPSSVFSLSPAWSFESLCAVSGYSAEDFAAQISASAELVLKSLPELQPPWSLSSSQNSVSEDIFMNDFRTRDTVDYAEWPLLSSHSQNMMNPIDGIFPYSPRQVCVDPTDVMPRPECFESPVLHALCRSPGPSNEYIRCVSTNVDHVVKNGLRSSPDAFFHVLRIPSPQFPTNSRSESDYVPTPRPASWSPSLSPSPCRSPRPRKRTMRSIKEEEAVPAFVPGTPILDAHRGVSLEELKAKASRHLMHNPGDEIDKEWFMPFAGKLTSEGLLLADYRCYINGCSQMNKRRDHILIHLSSHLDQRPFKCSQCSARFLRKNECKRHEGAHSGVRPYLCTLCPFDETSFTRQDLLRRHMQKTHRIDKENLDLEIDRPRKRLRRT